MATRNRRRSGAPDDHDAKRQKTEQSSDFYEFCLQAIATVKKLQSNDYVIANDFLELPPKKQYPNYYVEIKNPISINEIQLKVASKSYNTLDDFLSDFVLMKDNAIQFNDESSEIAQNAKNILKSITEQIEEHNNKFQAPLPKIKLTFGVKPKVEESKEQPIDLKSALLTIIEAVIAFKDNGVQIADPFLVEVSRKDYPDYFKLIKKAMALNTIKKTVNANRYSTLDDFKKDLDLVWSNAQIYNQEDSLIYQDSKTLERVANEKVSSLREELEQERVKRETETLKKDVNAKAKQAPKVEEVDEDEEEEDEEEEEDDDDEDEENEEEEEDDDDDEEDGSENGDSKPQKDVTPFSTTFEPSSYLSLIKEKLQVSPKTQTKGQDAFIQEVTISSSRAIYRQTVRNINPSQPTPPVFQNWFEYKFQALDDFPKSRPKSYSISLPSNSSGSISLAAGLNDSLIKRKHISLLTINGERVNPQPSIHYADTGRQLTSRYELKIPVGLNKIKFEVTTNVDTVKYDLSDTGNYKPDEEESIIFWVHVS